MQKITIYTDGGSRGNPGPSACAAVIKDAGGNILAEKSLYLGTTTNNQAEYQGVILALNEALSLGLQKCDISFYLDSLLVESQLNLKFKVKEPSLQPVFLKAWNLTRKFSYLRFNHVLRSKNTEADLLLNLELDRHAKKQ